MHWFETVADCPDVNNLQSSRHSLVYNHHHQVSPSISSVLYDLLTI
jgi:hypothetical protein